MITDTLCLQCIVDRIGKYDESVQHDTKLFDVRIIFLITALNASTTNNVRTELNGDIKLIKMLENILNCHINNEKISVSKTIISKILNLMKKNRYNNFY